MMTLEEKAECVARGVFAGLDAETRGMMAERMGELEVLDGQPLFLQGEPGHEVYVVVSGAIEIKRPGHPVEYLGPGDLAGEMAVLGGGNRSSEGRAVGNTRLLFLKDRALALLIQQQPGIAFTLFRVLVERLELMDDLVHFLSGPPRRLGELRFLSGDLAGLVLPLFHKEAILGRRLGSPYEDMLRVSLSSMDPALKARHASLRLGTQRWILEPLEGEITLGGVPVDRIVEVGSEDEIRIGNLRFVISVDSRGGDSAPLGIA